MPGFTTACPPGLPDHNRDIAYLVVDWLFDIVACAVVSIRLYSRGFLTRSFGSDDFIIICAAVSISNNELAMGISNLPRDSCR